MSCPPIVMSCTTLYIRDNPLYLCDEHSSIPAHSPDFRLRNPDSATLAKTVEDLEQDKLSGCTIEGLSGVWDTLLSIYKVLPAAGGLVKNQEGRILLLFRRGKWDLPKGKLDPGETLEQCALREVQEETGLSHLQLGQQIGETWHSYRMGSTPVLKHTNWYRMLFTGSELTIPQLEEDILDIQWVLPIHLPKYLKHTYPNIRDVFIQAGFQSGD
ncbi:MAG TPA: NUDIX hydrolase [Chitinophagaceae bacterium]|nr:NUDIX hydrolase [Chitinophagaceae bacterium]